MGSKIRRVVQTTESKYEKRTASIIGCFVLIVLCIFPLIYHDYYFDILETKYLFFCISVIITAVVMSIYSLINKKVHFNFKTITRSLTVPDWALVSFLAISTISTLFSKYRFEAFWGNEGRYTGLFLLYLYGISYFLVTRFLKFKEWYLDAFLASGILASLFGITDYFQMDLLGFKVDMKETQYKMFMSTIGNINTYTAYIAMIVAVSAILFATSKEWKKIIWYYICLVVSTTALIMGRSDNAYLALAALFGLSPLFLFANRKGLRNYFVILATFFSIVAVIQRINIKYEDIVLGVDSIFNSIASFEKLNYAIIDLWTIVVILIIADYFMKDKFFNIPIIVRYFWLALICLIVIGFVYVIYDANIAGNYEKYGSLQEFIVFSDKWGTNRGYIWRIAMENYSKFTPFQKLFGYGPDTFGIITVNSNYDEMINVHNVIYESAHNEYLQYLLTIGLFGLLAYLALLVGACIRMIRKSLDDSYSIAILFAILCYNAQALVNINLPIVTPIMWFLMMMGLSVCYQQKKKNAIETV